MEFILALLVSNCKGNHLPELAQAIVAQDEVSPVLLAKVVIVESRCNPDAYNAETDDAGLMQLNKVHGLSDTCRFDWRCSLAHGARLLAQARRPCEYNLGRIGSLRNPKTCLHYEKKLDTLSLEGK